MLMEVNTRVSFYGLYGNKLSFEVNDQIESFYDDLVNLENTLFSTLKTILNEWEDAYLGIDVVSNQYVKVYNENGKWDKDIITTHPITFTLKSGDDWLVDSMNQICGW